MAGDSSRPTHRSLNWVWDINLLTWVMETQPGGGGGGGGAVTIADGADTAQGTTTDAAVVSDVSGTLSGKVRGVIKILADVWDSVNHQIKVNFPASYPVTNGSLDGTLLATVDADIKQISTDVKTNVVLAAGTHVIGHVVVDSTAAPSTLPLPTGAATAAKQPALGVAGTPSADVLTVQGVTSMTPLKVDGSGVTQPVSGSLSVSNFPATQPVSGTVTVTPPTLTKGTQGATGFSVQDLKDAGRNLTNFFMSIPIVTTATDVLMSLTGYKSGAAVVATTTPAVVSAGKTYRLLSVSITYVAIATAGSAKFTLRANTGGVVAIGSPAVAVWVVGGPAAAAGVAGELNVELPEGMEFAAGTGIGISMVGLGATQTAAAVGFGQITLHGYEY